MRGVQLALKKLQRLEDLLTPSDKASESRRLSPPGYPARASRLGLLTPPAWRPRRRRSVRASLAGLHLRRVGRAQ